jgi:hypothetical protein
MVDVSQEAPPSAPTELDEWAAWLRRFCIPFYESTDDHERLDLITTTVPDANVGRPTKEHPGTTIVLMFVAGRFAGIVRKP